MGEARRIVLAGTVIGSMMIGIWMYVTLFVPPDEGSVAGSLLAGLVGLAVASLGYAARLVPTKIRIWPLILAGLLFGFAFGVAAEAAYDYAFSLVVVGVGASLIVPGLPMPWRIADAKAVGVQDAPA